MGRRSAASRRISAIYFVNPDRSVEKYPLNANGKLIMMSAEMSRRKRLPVPEINPILSSTEESSPDVCFEKGILHGIPLIEDENNNETKLESEADAYNALFKDEKMLDPDFFTDMLLKRSGLDFVFSFQVPSYVS